ncbi:MAG: hypothetical protein MJ052_02285 [Sphaerochaetaceae bacterium]|nr:hypothetical protein [Sphaerochaetaceae bacterium]
MGWFSVVPVFTALVLSVVTKNTVVSLAVACILGCFLHGDGVFGFTNLIMEALGAPSSVWTIMMVILFSVMIIYFERSGAIDGFAAVAEKHRLSGRSVQIAAWFLGLFCFADSMSPLFVGSVMRKLSDKAKVSREKLAYIADSTASPVSVIHPFSSWCPYLAGLAVSTGVFTSADEAYSFALRAIPFNFYAIFSVLLVILTGTGIVHDFGPMAKAQKRAFETGKVLADAAVPLNSDDIAGKALFDKPRIFLNFILPVLILVGICGVTVVTDKEPAICEAAMIVVIFMSVSFLCQGISLRELDAVFLDGVKNAMPAVMVLAVAYPLNTLTVRMGGDVFLTDLATRHLSPAILPCLIFIVAAVLSFATGTSWGTYAICVPIALPMAMSMSDGVFALLSFAAIAGGGVFGDHCSPLSDTSILSSMGAGSDHIDHIQTQLPYAFVCAVVSALIYLIAGFSVV